MARPWREVRLVVRIVRRVERPLRLPIWEGKNAPIPSLPAPPREAHGDHVHDKEARHVGP